MKSIHIGLSLATILPLLASVSPASATFTDVAPSHPYYQAILYLQQKGTVGGYPDGTFRANDTINRAELAKVLVAAQYPQGEINDCQGHIRSLFTDTPQKAWYTPYICTAFRNNIVSGYPDVSFRPANAISYAEAAKMIKETFDVAGPPEGSQCTSAYSKWFETSGRPDDDANPHWWQKFVCALQAVNAMPPSYEKPEQLVTRAEIAEMMYRIQVRKLFSDSTDSSDASNSSSSSTSSASSRNSSNASSIASSTSSSSSTQPGTQSSSASSSTSSQSSASSAQPASQQSSSSSSSTSLAANVSGATDLAFDLKGPATIPETGPLLSYTATVTNSGSLTTLAPVTVRFPKVSKLTYEATLSDAGCVLQTNGDVLCTYGTMGPGKSLTVVLKYTAGILCGESATLSGNLNSSEQQDPYVTNDADSVTTSSGCPAYRGNVYVTKDSVQDPSHQLLGGTIADPILQVQLRAEDQAVQIDQLQFTAESANGSTPSNNAARSVVRLEVYRAGDTTLLGSATLGGCEAQPVPANTFCVKLPAGKLVIGAGQTAVLAVRPRMKTDADGAMSGDRFRLTVRADSAAVQATDVNTGNALRTNDGDQMEDGEVFIGTSTAGANAKLAGENETVVLSKIISVQNNSPEGDNATLPSGITAIGQFRFSAAANGNTKNGLNKPQITDLIFTVRTQNVTLDAAAFQLYNVLDGSMKTPCSAFQTYGAPISGNASGIFYVTCKAIDASSVSSKIDSNGILDLALQGNILNAGDITSGTLQVSIESFSNANLSLIKNANGTINSAGSHISWNDTDVDSVGPFSWVDVTDQEVKSTLYGKYTPVRWEPAFIRTPMAFLRGAFVSR